MRGRRWRRVEPECVDQVANGPDANLDLTPVSGAPSAAVKAAWLPVLPGQKVPLIGERVYDEPCDRP